MNTWNGIGRLTRDPELRYTSNSKAVCNFTLALDGYGDNTYFIPVQCWGKVAENVEKYQTKGSLVGVTGELQSNRVEKDGVVRTYYVINAVSVQFLEYKNSGEPATDQATEQAEQVDEQDNDLPF